MTSRWRRENYALLRPHPVRALDALSSHAAALDNPGRMVPDPARKAAAAQVHQAEVLAAAQLGRGACTHPIGALRASVAHVLI
jgi:hypothetical protein